MKKKIAVLALLLLFCAGLAGCEKNAQPPKQEDSSDVLLPPPPEESQDPEPPAPQD